MSKYIIEIAEEYEEYFKGVLICGIADGKFAVDVIAREDLEELNSDYINEHFGELQDEAYHAGLNDAWEAAKRIVDMPDPPYWDVFGKCKSDLFKKLSASEAIAKLKVYEDKHSGRIEVGDEVIDKDGDMTIVTNIHERLFDGLCSDGSTMSDLFLEDVRKTGRHYDHIGKLLEAIRA